MTLTLSRSYPDDHAETTREGFWRVSCEGVYVGSIVYNSVRPEAVWNWSITVQDPSPGLAKTGMAEAREDAMSEFRAAWDCYREWLGDERWHRWVEHMAMVDARSDLWKRRECGEEPGGY
ncbi:hypothetical protein DK26_15215 [Bosea sp. WAO]|uniref:hypothetical protein n=1 Tax=Bosea sp. WAO TaxID=406341 RepID=UPI00074A9036|nr:hypothetical protein [Bosea sp. WAO]KUL94355.1 hypothetical protein DK26_15215 [Bosea sp. WAO]